MYTIWVVNPRIPLELTPDLLSIAHWVLLAIGWVGFFQKNVPSGAKLLQVESCQVIKSHRHTGHTAGSNGYIHTLANQGSDAWMSLVGWKLVTIVLVVDQKPN